MMLYVLHMVFSVYIKIGMGFCPSHVDVHLQQVWGLGFI